MSLKHNSKFACYTLLAKGDFPAELNITLPFSLVSNDVTHNKLVIMPAYWFMHNMYALARNAHKYVDRDKRIVKTQHIEYDYLAPDSVNELFEGLTVLRRIAAQSANATMTDEELLKKGDEWLNDPNGGFDTIETSANVFENNRRPTEIVKIKEAYRIYKELIIFYGVQNLLHYVQLHKLSSLQELWSMLPSEPQRLQWKNIGGQLIPAPALESLLSGVKTGAIESWDAVHQVYEKNGEAYAEQKTQHAFASLLEVLNISSADFTDNLLQSLLQQALATKEWMTERIYQSRAKDYQNAFKKMVYDNEAEMTEVVGNLDDNSFIQQQETELAAFRSLVYSIAKKFGS